MAVARKNGFETQPTVLPPSPHLKVVPPPAELTDTPLTGNWIGQYGHMREHGEDRDILITEQNLMFFKRHRSTREIELSYANSAYVVCVLKGLVEARKANRPSAPIREQAFYDMDGKFYDGVRPINIELASSSKTQSSHDRRHTVYLEAFDEKNQGQFLQIPAGEMYSPILPTYNAERALPNTDIL